MSYAIETKKRKFERILESLTDHTSGQTRTSLNTRNNPKDTVTGPDPSPASSKRRRITPVGNAQRLAQTSTASLITHYLPSSRLAFLERLESFRQVTKWHVSSTSAVNAVQWAKRGWICQDTDTVSCPSCKERLHVDMNFETHTTSAPELEEASSNSPKTDSDDDPAEMADALSQGLVNRYYDMITTAHTEACPWRRRGCDDSIQRIEGLLNMPIALKGLEDRYRTMSKEDTNVPEVVSLPSHAGYDVDEHELKSLSFPDQQADLAINMTRLAVTGWQYKEGDVIECRHCFRSLGLWLYRGEEPTVEHLDPTDSHLEYCPWRSGTAQDTELAIGQDEGKHMKQKVPGWVLVYLAIVKKNHKGKTPTSSNIHQHLDESTENPEPQLTPEQREKKMKDLLRRIRDLKKPFNVKSLLKRKDKS